MLGRQGHALYKLGSGSANNEYQKPGDAVNLVESYNPLSFNKHRTHDEVVLSHYS